MPVCSLVPAVRDLYALMTSRESVVHSVLLKGSLSKPARSSTTARSRANTTSSASVKCTGAEQA